MNKRITPAEQAEKLTAEEKESVLKHGRLGFCCSMLFILAAMLVVVGLGLSLMTVKSSGPSEGDNLRTTIFIVAAVVVAVLAIVGTVLTKKKCPKYNDALYLYLKKQSKQGK